MEKYFKVGIITASFGVHGEMKVFPTTDDPRRFHKLKQVFWNPEYRSATPNMPASGKGSVQDTPGAEDTLKPVEVESAKLSGKFVILKLKGIETPEEVQKLRQTELFVDRKNAVPLQKDEYYIADLIGMEVRDEEGRKIGRLREVIQTGANDVYDILLEDGHVIMLPAIRQCVLEINVEEGYMRIHILEGLIE